MIRPRTVRFWVAALSFLTVIASTAADAEDIPRADIDRLLAAGGYSPAWHIDQVAYNDNGPRWEINVFSAPRQIEPDICVSTILITDVVRSNGHYAFVETENPRDQVALQRCRDVFRKGGNFAELEGNITDDELVKTVRAVHLFVRSEGKFSEIPGRFETEELRPLLRQVSDNRLHWIEKRPDGNVLVSYIVQSIFPDILVFQVTPHSNGTSEIYVDRENGPDIVPAR